MLRSKFRNPDSFDKVLGGQYEYAGKCDIERAETTKMFNDEFEYDDDRKVVVPKRSDKRITVGESMYRVFKDFNCYEWEGMDLSTLVTSNVKTMYAMFARCDNLRKLDLSNFDTSKVEDMTCMFSVCKELKELDLSNFDTSKVKSMQGMFSFCEKLERVDLSSFVLSSVKDISRMFAGCYGLKEVILPKDAESRELVLKQLMQDTRDFVHEIKLVQE